MRQNKDVQLLCLELCLSNYGQRQTPLQPCHCRCGNFELKVSVSHSLYSFRLRLGQLFGQLRSWAKCGHFNLFSACIIPYQNEISLIPQIFIQMFSNDPKPHAYFSKTALSKNSQKMKIFYTIFSNTWNNCCRCRHLSSLQELCIRVRCLC